MISRREKMKRQFNSARESVFYAALDVLTDKKLNLSTRDVDKIVKTYQDLSPPYGNATKKCGSRPASLSSRQSSVDMDVSESESSKSEITKRRISSDVNSLKKKVKSESHTNSISETPKPRRPGPKCKQLVGGFKVEVDDLADMSQSRLDMSDVGTDETLVNTSQDSLGVSDKTLVHAHSESGAEDNSVDRQTGAKGRRSVGRPKKIKVESGIVKEKELDSKKELDVKKPVEKKTRTRSSLPEFVDVLDDEVIVKKEVMDEEDTETGSSVKDLKTRATLDRRDRRQSNAVKLTDKEKAELIEKYPSANNVSDHIKSELTTYFKNNKLLVNNKLRQKVQTALLNGKRKNRLGNGIIIDQSQRKLDAFFVKSPPQCNVESMKSPAKNVSRVLNELSPTRDRLEANNIERTTILRSGLKVTDCQSGHRNGSTPHRQSPALSERSFDGRSVGSPGSRQKHDSLNVSSVRERLFDDDFRRMTRSRESTPESTTSVKSGSSHKRTRHENPRTQTRSMTPSSGGKDSDESESENIFSSETRRLRR